MPFVCLWSPSWQQESSVAIQTRLLSAVPRIVLSGELVWVDVRGLPLLQTLYEIRDILAEHDKMRVCIGVAETPVAAEVAARYSQQVLMHVPSHGVHNTEGDREFLKNFQVSVLHPDVVTDNLLYGAGIETCGELAELTQEAVEVRFGAAGVKLWHLARAHDTRRIFLPVLPSLPESSFEWTDYTVERVERLVFIVNALCGNVCDSLQSQGSGALSMMLVFSLGNKSTYNHLVRAARPTSSKAVWMRLLRAAIEQVKLLDGVTGLLLRVDSIGGLGVRQGDLFDPGFATAGAAEEAIGQLVDDMGDVAVWPENTKHPLKDRSTVWNPVAVSDFASVTMARSVAVKRRSRPQESVVHANSVNSMDPLALTLQLLPSPVRVSVEATVRYGHLLPVSYWYEVRQYRIIDAAGPDVVEGGEWDNSYARHYYRCVNDIGGLVWIYRDGHTDLWYLHGWWD